MSTATQIASHGITAIGLASCLGRGGDTHTAALQAGASGLTPLSALRDWPAMPFDCHVGAVEGLEQQTLPAHVAAYDNRATRLLMAALDEALLEAVESARDRHGAARVAVVLGTSTSGVERLETAYRDRPADAPLPAAYSLRHHNDHQAVTAFLMELFALHGPGYAISTACSSSAKALVDAVQLIEAGVADAVLAGGVDSLCLTSLNGFEALELVSRAPSRPCDANRDGLSIGEGAALLLVERDTPGLARLAGFGETSDGHNMSTPPPDGAGARAAMEAALAAADVAPEALGFVNLHGTATPSNDVAECAAVAAIFGDRVPAFSLKGAVGHTLGAAGALEAALSILALRAGLVPGTVGLETPDPAIRCRVPRKPEPTTARVAMSNAFGFGGNNAALLLEVP